MSEFSPFLEIPESEHIARNRSGFAVLDAYPVTPGHTLVVPHRLIATWWQTEEQERRDLLALVDEVKAILDDRFRPDGYNVGFNAGRAAGQTIDHLHLHVIPRTKGDMDDPRGGVRHVIPSRGNYLLDSADEQPVGQPPTAEIELIDGLERELLPVLRGALQDPAHDRVDIVVSFVKRSGIELVLPDLRDALRRPSRPATVRLLTTDYLGITEPAALEQLHDLALDHPAPNTSGGSVQVRVHRAGRQSFHPKAYIFWSSTEPRSARSYVGSSNLTASGLSGGLEWNVGFAAVERTRRSFEALWGDSRSQPLDGRLLDALAQVIRPSPVSWSGTSAGTGAIATEIEAPHVEDDELAAVEPHDVQLEALEELARSRAEGNTAGLVVMATGLGKTYLAAFDAVASGCERVLFIAHRHEILTQARDTFRRALPTAKLGLFTGKQRDQRAQVLFASIQSLANHLERFAPDEFEYIVVDEFHHAAAGTYRKVMDHFRPRFLLGLTATPDRMDGADILALCHDNLVFSCDLVEGIERGRLATFTYHGVHDPTDYSVIPWRRGRFDESDLEVALASDERARAVFDAWQHRAGNGSRTLGFCVSVAHADYMARWFADRGIRAVAVHSGPSSSPRAASVRALGAGELDAIFTVDVFNEGLDVPEIDTVLMLRPTQSPVVFQQQLGRGLRLSEGKVDVTVIDMLGNHEAFLLRPRALLTLSLGRVPNNRELLDALRSGVFDLPLGCEVDLDLEVIDLLGELIARRSRGADLLADYIRDYVAEEGRRPTKTQTFRAGVNPAPSATKRPWFEMLAELDALDGPERSTAVTHHELLARFESDLAPATKSYKMVTLRALLALGALRTGATIDDLVERARQLMLEDPRLVADVRGPGSIPIPETARFPVWRRHWMKNPIAALTGPTRGAAPLFEITEDRLQPTFQVEPGHGETFDALVSELVEYRLAHYLTEHAIPRHGTSSAPVYVLKVSHSGGKPIIRFDRETAPDLPEGEDVPLLLDGKRFVGDFRQIALNVIRREGEQANALAEVLRGWFGPSAGQPGTAHRVVAEGHGEYWTIVPDDGG